MSTICRKQCQHIRQHQIRNRIPLWVHPEKHIVSTLSPRGLLEFLSFAFHGGTSLNEVGTRLPWPGALWYLWFDEHFQANTYRGVENPLRFQVALLFYCFLFCCCIFERLLNTEMGQKDKVSAPKRQRDFGHSL